MSTHFCLLLFFFIALQDAPQGAETPSFLPAEAEALTPLAKSPLAQEFLAAAKKSPPFAPRTIYRKGRAREWLSAADFEKLDGEAKKLWQPQPVGEMMYQGLFYGTPSAYLLPIEHLASAGGPKSFKGLKIADFGHGGIGQLRLFAAQGAEVAGIDVDPIQPLLFSEKGDQGPQGDHGGSVRLVTGRFPSDAKVVESVGENYDLFLSKNTLKRGYVHPQREADPRMQIDLGVSDEAYVTAVAKLLKPGGWFVIYNLAPAQNPPDKPFLPMADGRSPFTREVLEAAGFDVIQFDEDVSPGVREFGKLIGWDKPPTSMKLETDLFAWVTICRKKG
jgi:hypothetical protein